MLDHLLWGVPELDEGIRAFAERSGVRAAIGGRHPGAGTHNALLDFEAGRYLEIIAPDPSQNRFSDFGLLLRDLIAPGLLTWAARAGDVEKVAAAARDAGLIPGEISRMSRRKPDGELLEGRLLEIGGHPWGPRVPFFIEWHSGTHPSRDAPRGCRLANFSLADPDPAGLRSALSSLGLDAEVRPTAGPALRALVESPHGTLVLDGPPLARDPGSPDRVAEETTMREEIPPRPPFSKGGAKDQVLSDVASYPLLDALRERRSRRFGVGMEMKSGPMRYKSRQPPLPLAEDEEAALAFAACGVTGHALGELMYEPGEGGAILAGLLGRTVASGDAIHTVSVFVTRDDATYLLKRPRDFAPAEIEELAELARRGELTELYRRSRIKIKDARAEPPLHPMFNLDVNRWSIYDPASTYFLPVAELTLIYINGVLEILGESTGAFILDERAGFRPAGLKRFAKSKGGHLHDDPRDERVMTIQQLEGLVSEFVTIEQGMVLQNLALMTQALGLGGFPHWAAHPFGWLEALGFRMRHIRGSRYLAMPRVLGALVRLLGKDPTVGYAVGLEKDGEPLLTPYSPPYYPSMEAAVRAVIELKFGREGVFSGGVKHSAWRDPSKVADAAREPSPQAIDATIAYCDYVYRRYRRFPAYPPPFRTVLGYQASHLDIEFYDRFYKPEALSDTQRRHMEEWHPRPSNG